MIRVRVEGEPEEAAEFAEKLKDGANCFRVLYQSKQYPNMDSINVRIYMAVELAKEAENVRGD